MANRKKIGAFTPEQATDLIAFMREAKASGLHKRQVTTPIPDTPESYRVNIFNDSAEQIPAYACMQVDGTFQLGNQTYIKVIKPDKTDGVYLFNNDRAIYKKSTTNAMPWGVVRMLTNIDDPVFDPGAQFVAVPGQWYIEEGDGPFVGFGPDKNKKKVIKGRIAAAGGGGGTGSQVIEFTIIDPSSASSESTSGSSSVDEELCGNQVYDAPESIMANVTRRPCGVPIVYGEDDAGNVEVHDRLESFLFERSLEAVVGKKGLAVLMSGNADDPSSASSGGSSSAELPCEWVIIWIDWFRWVRVQTNTVVGADRITFSYKNVKVWDDCKLADEVVIGTDCDEASSTSSAV